ncbi:MAG: hypothetical protein Q9170_004709 [Blastenia crenularia]
MLSARYAYITTLRSTRDLPSKLAQGQPWASIARAPTHSTLLKVFQRFHPQQQLASNYSTALPLGDARSSNPSGNGFAHEQDLQASLSGAQESTSTSAEQTIQQVRSNRPGEAKSQRSRAEQLKIHRKGKEFGNQYLKDQGTRSHDWREPLHDIEKYWVPRLQSPALSRDRFPDIPVLYNVRADKILEPEVWTRASFLEYVVLLVRSVVHRQFARQIYSNGETHDDAVADVLENLFTNRKLKYVFSSRAADWALRYFLQIRKIARGRDLFRRIQELQKNLNPSIYNGMLEAAADHKDLANFTYILKMMIGHKVYPDSYSWLYLARAVQSDEVRLTIINRLIEREGTEDPALLKQIMDIYVPQMMVNPLRSGEDLQPRLEMLSSRFGSEWTSAKVCQQIVDEVGIRRSVPQAITVLKDLHGRGYKPSQGMLLLLLRQCSWTRAHELAISVLRLFIEEYHVPLSTQIYDVLFEQAWNGRLYNCCRVVWTHACLFGYTNYNMQKKVADSLKSARPLEFVSQSRTLFWEQSAGKVIAGYDRQSTEAKFWEMMSVWKPKDKSRHDRDQFLRKARSILDDDLAAIGQYETPKPLHEIISNALRLDRQWSIGQALKEVPVECKRSQAVDVDFSRRYTQVEEQLTDPLKDIHETGSLEEAHPETADLCWMSPKMRSRPCQCRAYVKERLLTHPRNPSQEEHAQ